jgi:hypothetical protein
MIHLHNGSYTAKDATVLLIKARELTADENVVVRDSRVSKKYIEYDTSIPDNLDIAKLFLKLERISPVAGYDHVIERHMDKEEAIKRAIELFNDEKYWGTHEVLEAVWKATPAGAERNLLNGIILVAAAFVHDEKDEYEICLSILRRAMKKLEDASGNYHGIDMDRFASLVQQILSTGVVQRFTI